MPRAVTEWIGKSDDSRPPPRVCQRVFDRASGICHFCGMPIQKPGQAHETDHVKALINGGENRESNLAPIHKKPCHAVKTGVDVNTKAKVAAVRQKHIGVKRKTRPISSKPLAPSDRTRAEKPRLEPKRLFRSVT